MNNDDVMQLWLCVAVIVVMVAAGIGWTAMQWIECRGAGFSIFYCLKHIS